MMSYAILIILVALLQYSYFLGKVGYFRAKLEVHAPKTTGNEKWERLFRVQQNTMEQLIIFIPATYFFSSIISDEWVLLPGIIFIIGRALYSASYISNPNGRGLGMIMSFIPSVLMILSTLGFWVMQNFIA